ncbi:MAG: hypothetical protein WC340_11890 [Kiritimatiellia bacterium]
MTRMFLTRQTSWWVLALTLAAHGALAGGYGEYASHTNMPPVPDNPSDYESMWDTFVLRMPGTGAPLSVKTETTRDDKSRTSTLDTNDFQVTVRTEYKNELRVLSGFDALPWNGRQIVRDAEGNWFVLAEQAGLKIFLATGTRNTSNQYRPRGGDLATMELIGEGDQAIIPWQGSPSRASMVVDGKGSLHVVWHTPEGLWHIQAEIVKGNLEKLREKGAWTAPRKLAERSRPGDIIRDSKGDVAVSYSINDTVYYLPVSGEKAEAAGGLGAGMQEMLRSGGRVPMSQRESQDAVMDLATDGSVWLAFRRDFAIWVAQRTPAGEWLPAERAAREYTFHPSIMVVDGRPLVTFLHEGLRRIPLDIGEKPGLRAGGGASIGYATRTADGWRTDALVKAEEIEVFRRGMWGQRGNGRIFPQIEQLGWPVLFRDPHGVVSTMWQNTTRRWAYSARWMGDAFGQVQECRGPFNAPCLPVNAEKLAPADAGDVGLLFYAAAGGGYNSVIFDRLAVPSLSVAEDREVLFLDSLEVSRTSDADFVLNQMKKPSSEPSLSPRGSNTVVWGASVRKHGNIYVMGYSSPQGGLDDGTPRFGVAVSRDGIHFEKTDKRPEGLPPADETPTRALQYWRGKPENDPPAYYENPEHSDPQKKYVRLGFSTEQRGTYWLEYSPDAKSWGERIPTTATDAMRERAMPNFYNATDPERPIRIYSRVYTETGRSWGVIWSRDLMHWSGMEHLLDPDEPYTKRPAGVGIGDIGKTGKHYAMRGQVYMDSVAGKGEDEIYASSVQLTEGLYFCFYWPGAQGRPLTDVGLAVSRDGFNFTRVKNGERVLPIGPPGAWDSGYIFQMSPMLDGDTVRVYYRGTAGAREGTDGFKHNLTEIGLALIRVNGWTYYTPQGGCEQATVTTIPIQSPEGVHKGLTANITGTAGKAGAFAVEVLDAATGEPLEGFGLSDCLASAEDGIAVPITWRGGNMLPTGRNIRLRFHLGAAGTRLYSFGFRSAEITQ